MPAYSGSVTDQPHEDQSELGITITPDMMGGVWANFAAVRHSSYEFTLDFVRLGFGETAPGTPVPGVVVARVNLSPLLVSQLLEALSTNWNEYAKKAMPREVHDDPTDDAAS